MVDERLIDFFNIKLLNSYKLVDLFGRMWFLCFGHIIGMLRLCRWLLLFWIYKWFIRLSYVIAFPSSQFVFLGAIYIIWVCIFLACTSWCSGWKFDLSDSYPRIIPRIIPPNHTPQNVTRKNQVLRWSFWLVFVPCRCPWANGAWRLQLCDPWALNLAKIVCVFLWEEQRLTSQGYS